ncbi:MAG: hypothetical protein OQJ89_09920 [Kangiellaceae bacterium]|nr:hypothetical protein [Kangiellaceae bacterium]MCW8997477.1 hypothetical protein [Kangiellaceae bacterium]MCW9017272.1 hypothetical protein [Kangiellaceae bacterium]
MEGATQLERIATASESIANASYDFWPIVVSAAAALAGAYIGYWASQKAISKQEEINNRKLEEKKKLVLDLLNDEMKKRWHGEIRKHIVKATKTHSYDDINFFSTMKFSECDLFVFRAIANSFQDYHFLEDNQLVSKIIHGYLLYIDLSDLNVTCNRFIEESLPKKEELTKQFKSQVSDPDELGAKVEKELDRYYYKTISELTRSLTNKVEAIDRRFEEIIEDIDGMNGNG